MSTGPALNGSHTSAVATGRLVSVPALVAALRRRWMLWMSGGVLGALAALALSFAVPPEHTATTILLLQQPSLTDRARAMATDAQLVESRSVAQAVIDDLGLAISARELVEQYQPSILSQDLLQIKVSASSDGEAVRLADAVARSFLAFRNDEIKRQSAVAVRALEERERQLASELRVVTEGINAQPDTRSEDAVRTLGDLYVRRTTFSDEVAKVRERIELSATEAEVIVQKSRIVDPAGEDARTPVRTAVVNMVAGIMLGLLLTTGWIVLQEVTSERLRRRADVAAALGAPVSSCMRTLRGPRWVQRRRFRHLLADPPPDLSHAVEHLHAILDEPGAKRRRLVVVSAESDAAAALVLGATAVRLMHEDRSVLVVDLTRSNVLGRLTAVVRDEPSRLPLSESAAPLWVSFSPEQMPQAQMTGPSALYQELAAQVDIVLSLATVDPAIGAKHLFEAAGVAVAVVTAGRSSETALRSLAQMLEAAGVRLHSTILVGADHADESVGLVGGWFREPAPNLPRPGVKR